MKTNKSRSRKNDHLKDISIAGGTSLWQRIFLWACLVSTLTGLVLNFTLTATIMSTIGIIAYGLAASYYLYVLCVRIATDRGIIRITETLLDQDCPYYAVLIPIAKDGYEVVRQSIEGQKNMNYPADRIMGFYVVEEDDRLVLGAISRLKAEGLWPKNFSEVVVPIAEPGPRGKPRALNYALRKEVWPRAIPYQVIFDAEDVPDQDQLRKAATAWSILPENVSCLQAELRWFNWDQNWFTRMLQVSYAMSFRFFNRGLCAVNGVVPLGGTSNHFRVKALEAVGYYDSLNVSEDADLGVKLARARFRVLMLDSVTTEEATYTLKAQVKQGSRWKKGFIAVAVAHTRKPTSLIRDLGFWKSISFAVHFLIAPYGPILAPVFIGITIWYVFTGTTFIHEITPSPAYFVGSFSQWSTAIIIIIAMSSVVETKQYKLLLTVVTIPVYWNTVHTAVLLKAELEILRGKWSSWDLTKHGMVTQEGNRSIPSGMPIPTSSLKELDS